MQFKMCPECNVLYRVMVVLFVTSSVVGLEISPPLSDLYVATGRPLWWTCSVLTMGQSTPLTVTFRWTFQNGDIYQDGTRIPYANGTLYFPQVLDSHLGQYTCIVSDSKVANESSAWLKQAYISNTFVLQPINQSVELGGAVVIICRIDGQPMPILTWKFNGVTVLRTSNVNIIDAGPGYSLLQISNITYTDSGSYTCNVNHVTLSLPMSSAPAVVRVYGKPVVANVPRDQTVPIGYNATFYCSANSDPKATVTWLFKSSAEPQSLLQLSPSQPYISIDDVTGSLTLTNLNSSSSGNYICNWNNQYGSASAQAFLTVTGQPQPPVFVTRPSDTSVTQGDDLHLFCNGIGNPTPDVMWVNPAGLIISGNSNEQTRCNDTQACNASWADSGNNSNSSAAVRDRATIDVNGSLTLINITSDDLGVYVCRLFNSEGVAESFALINVFYKPYFVIYPQSITVDAGSTFSLSCQAAGNPKPEISWTFPGNPSLNLTFTNSGMNSNNNEVVAESGDLTIRKVGKAHYGVFTCFASNNIGSSAASATVSVSGVPYFSVIPVSQGVIEGDNVILQCQVDANPAAAVYWYYRYIMDPSIQSTDILQLKELLSQSNIPTENMTLLQVDQNSHAFLNGTSLKFVGVQESDAGIYLCLATNGYGSAFEPAILRVITFPEFQVEPANTKAALGSTVRLDCFTVGIPVPSQRWVFNQRKVEMDQRKSFYINGSLFIENLQESDLGTYTCLATNQAGQRSISATLTLSRLPYFITPPSNTTAVFGEKAVLTCRGNSQTAFEVLWYLSDLSGNRLNLLGLAVINVDNQPGALLSDTNIVQSSGENRIQVSPEGDLVIGCVEHSDALWYICFLHNSDGNTPSSPVFLTVNDLPFIMATEAPENASLEQNVNLTCQAGGSSNPVISWVAPLKVEYTELSVGEVTVSVVETSLFVTSTLSIQNIQMDRDAGDWLCKACNSVGCRIQKVTLNLEGQAIIRQIIGKEYDNEYFISCVSAGVPLPNITYGSKGAPITNLTDGHIVVDHDLLVKKDKILSEYTCQAANVYGNQTVVLLPPINVLITNVQPTSNSFIVSLNYSQPNPYLTPNKIILLITTEGSNTWQNNTFNLSSNIEDYLEVEKGAIDNSTSVSCDSKTGNIVKRDISPLKDISVSVTSNGTQFMYSLGANIRGLIPNTAYLLQAAVHNILGSGPYSQLVSAMTLAAPPAPVTNVAVKIYNRTATVTWTKPDPLNGLPKDTSVTVRLFNSGSNSNTIATMSVNVLDLPEVIFGNLQPGEYNLNIFVSNRQTNTTSNIVTATFAVQDQPPSFIMNITAITALNAHVVLINWTAILNPDTISAPVTGYTIEISTAEINETMKVQNLLNVSGATVSSWMIENLLENRVYYMRVASMNNAGIGPFSDPKNVTTHFSSDVIAATIPWWGVAIIVAVISLVLAVITVIVIVVHKIKLAKRQSVDLVNSESEEVVSNNVIEEEMQHDTTSQSIEGHENQGFVLY